MSAPTRPGLAVKRPTMRPPTNMRPPPSRAQTATPSLNRRPSEVPPSPAQSVQGGKRKERDFDQDQDHETNINVVVRCRGRNDRELRENSGVVVKTDGVKGKNVELSMGPSALSNKTYQFDKVFSPAADQAMLFDDVVEPILDEVRESVHDSPFLQDSDFSGARRFQLYHFRIWPNRHWKDIHHVRRHHRYATSTRRRRYHPKSLVLIV